MLLEKQTRIQQRLAQQAIVYQLQHDQQPPHAAIAIQKRMDGLKLHVRQRGLHQRRRCLWQVVEETLQVAQTIRNRLWRRRHKRRITRSRTANPHLAATEFARCFAAPQRMIQQHRMHFTDQAKAQWKAAAQPSQAVFQRGHVAAHFVRVLHRDTRLLVDFVKQQIGQRGLRTFDL